MPKILIVEDNEMNRDMLSRRLERRGFEVVIAVDGGEGVAMARSELPDLVLMDMSLPVMNGWEATRAIRAEPSTAHLPVIALTAHSMPGDREKAMEAGCDDYDTKPVDLPRLLVEDGGIRRGAARVTPEEARELRHELRTPVNHLIGYAELLLEEEDASEADVEALEAVRARRPRRCSSWSPVSSATAPMAMPADRPRRRADSVDALVDRVAQLRVADRRSGRHLGLPASDIERLSVAPLAWVRSQVASPTDQSLVARDAGDTAAPLAGPPGDGAGGRRRRSQPRRARPPAGQAGLRHRRGPRWRRGTRAPGRARRDIDLVLLDVMMPRLDGFAVLERHRADPPSATSR